MTTRGTCFLKRSFPDEAMARAELARAIRARILGDRTRHEQVAYECLSCGSWHLSADERLDGRIIAPRRETA